MMTSPLNRAQATPTPEENRFLRPWLLGEASTELGIVALAVSALVLSGPLATALFSVDGETLVPPVVRAIEWLRLALAVTGFAAIALGSARVIGKRRLPLTRGTALLCAFAFATAFAMADSVLRVRGLLAWGSALRTPLPVSAMRNEAEYNLRPGRYAARVLDELRPGSSRTVLFSINRLGLRGPDPSPQKARGVTRIVCLGGSTTFGYTVTDGEEWPARLAEALRPRASVEVLNAGRPGSTTWSNFRYLRDRLVALEPDVVVLYEGFNDMWRGVRRHAAEQSDYGPVDEEAPGVPETLDLGPVRPWPLRWSFGAFWTGLWLKTRLEKPARRPVPDAGSLFHPGIVGLFEANLAAAVRLCRRHGILPVVATFAGCDDAAAGEAELARRLSYVRDQIPPLDGTLALRGMELYRERARIVARREGAPLVDLAGLMPKDPDLFTDTVHFSSEGERRLASILADALLRDRQAGPVVGATPARIGS
jgi:lysophospholipase L1-like esterase